MMTRHRFLSHLVVLLAALITFVLLPLVLDAQTKITAPKNKYTPDQDVKLGQQAAAEVRQAFPLVNEAEAQGYVDRIGDRLVDAIPPEFRHPQFQYSFKIVNASDLNAFALPGGPMFINRGMIEGVKNEGELAGVMAHELSHVALRHGTAQATKAAPYEIGTVAGQIVGAIVGGTAGQVIATGSRFGLGAAFLRYSREYEKQADILGAQIMARAGYHPREMAEVFKMLEETGRNRAPEWLSAHPNPGNRYSYITKEAQSLRVNNAVRPTGQLASVQADLDQLPPAPTMEQLEQAAQSGNPQGTPGATAGDRPVGTSGSIPPPSPSYRRYNSDVFTIAVPDNWQPVSGNNVVRFAPEGAVGQVDGQQAFMLGIEVGVENAQGDLRSASEAFIEQLMRSNPNLRPQTNGFQRTELGGRQGLRVAFNNASEGGQAEIVVLETTQLRNGSLFYAINVAPQNQYATYQPVFHRVLGSLQLNDR